MYTKPEEIVSDEEVERVHANANFGSMPKRDVLNYGTLKTACGYYHGSTSTSICIEHGLITEKTHKLTKKGRQYLWAVFGEPLKV